MLRARQVAVGDGVNGLYAPSRHFKVFLSRYSDHLSPGYTSGSFLFSSPPFSLLYDSEIDQLGMSYTHLE